MHVPGGEFCQWAWWTRRRLSLASVIVALPVLLGIHIKSHVSQLPTPSWPPYAPDNDQGILFRLDDNGLDTDFSLRPLAAKLAPSNLTVNLVIAKDDISWTEKLRDYLPNLRIIQYVSDSIDADYHPPLPRKGREALIYHTYFYDFYNDLHNISIIAHPHKNPWHIEPSLLRSISFALSHLNLKRVLERRYFNLRISWKEAYPVRINTSRPANKSKGKEESYIRQAFRHNFDNELPVIIARACCSQFAVSQDAIHRNPQSQYKKHINWLISTKIRDYITRRV